MEKLDLKGRQSDGEESRNYPVAASSFPYAFLIGVTVLFTVVLAYLVYGFFTLQEGQKALYAELQQQAKKTQTELDDLKKRAGASAAAIGDLKSDTGVIRQKVGVTQSELNTARVQVQEFKEQQTQAVAEIHAALGTKAESAQVSTQLTQLQKDAEQKIGAVNKDVGAVRTDVEETKKTLGDTQRQLLDVRDTLSSQIAKNKGELDELRRKGERQYVEFSVTKKAIATVHDIRLELRGTDPKKSKFDLNILVDDQRLEKKSRTANEPVQFLVGKDKVRYEIVVNTVGKDKIDGYLSLPKDRTLSAERPVMKQ